MSLWPLTRSQVIIYSLDQNSNKKRIKISNLYTFEYRPEGSSEHKKKPWYYYTRSSQVTAAIYDAIVNEFCKLPSRKLN